MSGQRIEDHGFWAGGKSKGSVFPEGAKTKHVGQQTGFGALTHYEDTEEAIDRQQDMNKKKVHGHPMKPGHRQ